MRRVLILLFAFSALSPLTVSGQTAKQYMKAGDDFMEVRNYQDAIAQYTKAIELDPSNYKGYVQRALAYEKTKNFHDAAADFDRAVVFRGNDAELLFQAGNAYYQNKEYAIAVDRLSKANDAKANYLDAYQVRSMANLALERYNDALEDCKKALRLKEDERNLYNLARVYEKLEMYNEAEDAFRRSVAKNRRVTVSHLALAQLLFDRGKYDEAMASVNEALALEEKNRDGLILKSRIDAAQMNYPKAIDDISTALLVYNDDPELYLLRGEYYQKFNQHAIAIHDLSKVIELDPELADVYYKRAWSYEQIQDYKSALKDYDKLLEMSKYDGNAQRLYAQAEQRMFELNRESKKPEVELTDPVAKSDKTVDIRKGIDVFPLTGLIHDDSNIKLLQVNNFTVPVEKTPEGYLFRASISLKNSDQITVQVSDVYDNMETVIYNIRRTEVDPPKVNIIAPYASETKVLYLDTADPIIFIEGKIEDESRIRSIYIDSVAASYIPSDINPSFAANVRIANKSRITVVVEDNFGNRSETEFTLNRDAASFSENPMGKTWAIFIENSNYESFATLDGPTKDVTLMKTALAKYQIHNFIYKKDMTKQEMERFFAIELRDMVRGNKVNSILIWYAGHGKFINETGYWIPVDARRDDEFTYFNINALKASMQSYSDLVTHTLVVTDACESGPSFYQAMRSAPVVRNCEDWQATRFKSSQVFSSAGYELAVDNSQFTRTFANVLANNPDACIPIESIVMKVTSAVVNNNQQKPQFGKIAGLEDEDGTFFFIPKSY
ncbi:MAG: tetratricopeptide repeat protein [Bacteroidota bacterium]